MLWSLCCTFLSLSLGITFGSLATQIFKCEAPKVLKYLRPVTELISKIWFTRHINTAYTEHKITIRHTSQISKSFKHQFGQKRLHKSFISLCLLWVSQTSELSDRRKRDVSLCSNPWYQKQTAEVQVFMVKSIKKHPIFNGCWVNCAGPKTFCSIYRFLNYLIHTVFQMQFKPTRHSYFDTS